MPSMSLKKKWGEFSENNNNPNKTK